MSNTGTESLPPVLVLDGGFSTQVSRHVGTNPDGDPLWCCKFLQTNPEDVYKAHLDFLRAGSDVIATNTYQASVEGFVKYLGLTSQEGYGLILRVVELAKRARASYYEECEKQSLPFRRVLIAGSVGPYGAYLHDGSEYDGSYAEKVSAEEMREWHSSRLKALVEAEVDFIAFETLPCQKEAVVLVKLLMEYPKMKAWLSFSCKDENKLANGEDFKSTVRRCYDMNPDQLVAVGVNCCPPTIVTKLLQGVNDGRQSPIPFVTYPNSGEKYKPEEGWIGKDQCEPLATYVQEWLDVGVRYIGSCCRTCDVDVKQIREQVQLWTERRTKF